MAEKRYEVRQSGSIYRVHDSFKNAYVYTSAYKNIADSNCRSLNDKHTASTYTTPPDELDREAATNIPDGKNDWVIGSETFTRQEVFKLLYTQRAMISNDFKQCFCDDMIDEMYSFFNLPMRTPKF